MDKFNSGFAGVDELAARLGVEPSPGHSTDALIMGESGQYYSIVALINALLDRLDAATRERG